MAVAPLEGDYIPGRQLRKPKAATVVAQRGLINKLTEVACKAARPGKLWDGLGLYLLVMPTGAKRWRFKYRYGGKEKLMALGTYPDTSIATARKARDAARVYLEAGRDPMQQKKLGRAASVLESGNTFAAAAAEWLASMKVEWSDGYYQARARLLDRFLLPKLGALPIAEIDTGRVLDVLRKISAPELLAKSRTICVQVFRYGVATRRCANNPMLETQRVFKRPAVHHRATGTEAEMPQVFEALRDVSAEAFTKLALYYQIATCVRPGEVRFATWGEIDNAKKLWRISAERMKTRVPFTQPLTPLALAILQQAAKLRQTNTPDELIFPGYSKGGHLSENAFIALLKRAGLKDKQTAHGFRAAFRTWASEREPKKGEPVFDPIAVELCLAHRPSGTQAAYDRSEYIPARRAILTTWGAQCEQWGMQLK